jgi:hypothetical protein
MTPNGITLPSGRNDFSCNVNNDSDVIPSDPGGTGGSGSGGGGDSDVGADAEAPPGAGVPNPADPVGQAPAPEICGANGLDDAALPGDELEVCDEACEGQYNEWYVCDESPTVGATTVIHPSCVKISEGEGAKLIVGDGDTGKRVLIVSRCPDPASPDGYGEPQLSPYSPPVESGGTFILGLRNYTVTWEIRTENDSRDSIGCNSFTVYPGAISTNISAQSRVFNNVYGIRASGGGAVAVSACEFIATPERKIIFRVETLDELGNWSVAFEIGADTGPINVVFSGERVSGVTISRRARFTGAT